MSLQENNIFKTHDTSLLLLLLLFLLWLLFNWHYYYSLKGQLKGFY